MSFLSRAPKLRSLCVAAGVVSLTLAGTMLYAFQSCVDANGNVTPEDVVGVLCVVARVSNATVLDASGAARACIKINATADDRTNMQAVQRMYPLPDLDNACSLLSPPGQTNRDAWTKTSLNAYRLGRQFGCKRVSDALFMNADVPWCNSYTADVVVFTLAGVLFLIMSVNKVWLERLERQLGWREDRPPREEIPPRYRRRVALSPPPPPTPPPPTPPPLPTSADALVTHASSPPPSYTEINAHG